MITVEINEKTLAGRKILKDIAANPRIGSVKIPDIERDENGKPTGMTLDEFKTKLNNAISVCFDKE